MNHYQNPVRVSNAAGWREALNWREVGLFILLTFVITFAVNGLLAATVGYGNNVATMLLAQLQMLIPAAVAIALGLFFLPGSPIYFRTFTLRPRWFFYLFLGYTLIYVVMGVLAVFMADQAGLFSAAGGILTIVMLLAIIVLRVVSGREPFRQAGLAGGRLRDWLFWGLMVVLFYALQTGLNALFNLGQAVDPAEAAASLGAAAMPPMVFMIVAFIQTVLVGPLIGIPIAFGEEYGWRGYLQTQLVKLGKRRGILLLGVIWGMWHWPMIWMGHNYPGQPVLGTFIMTGYTILLAFVLGHVVLKTGSVWLAAFLHALNNQTVSFLMGLVYMPENTALAFGSGVLALLTLTPVVLLLLRDPVWRDEPAAAETEPEGSVLTF